MSLSIVLLTSAPAWRGSGTSLAKIARGLMRAGHRAVVLAGSREVCARFAGEGVQAERVPLERTAWRETRAVSNSLRHYDADLILVDTPRDVRLAVLATGLRPIPILFRYNLSRRTLESHLVSRLLFRRVGAIAYQSEYARDRALRTSPWLAGRRGQVIGNGYDSVRHTPDLVAAQRFRLAHGLQAGRPIVLSGAALFLDKGYGLAIEAMAKVAATRPVDYVVCGAGDDAEQIVAASERAGLPIRCAGLLDSAEWLVALDLADIVLHPATGELFSNVVAEAMLHCLPVVALDSGATPELIGRGGETGVLVPQDDADALASAVSSLLDDPERRTSMGDAARARILDRFPLETMESGYVRLIEDLAGALPTVTAHPPARLPA